MRHDTMNHKRDPIVSRGGSPSLSPADSAASLPSSSSITRWWIRVGVMARGSTGALLLLTISAVAGFRPSHARSLSDDQVTGHLWHLKPSLDYGQSPGGATIDNHAGWNIANAEGYNPDDNAICAAGLTHCHYTPACFDLQTSAQHCGSCDLSCDFYTQECKTGACVCKEGFSACAARGGRCLDSESCPAGSGTGRYAIDINTQGVGGTPGALG